jgi:hypothetical protein
MKYWEIEDTKTPDGERFLPMTPEVRDITTEQKRSLVKWKNRVILQRFLLNLDDKIYHFMPRYAKKKQKTLCHGKSQEWRKISVLRSFRALIRVLFICHGR